MKILSFLMTMLLMLPALAGPGDDPLVPWPTSVSPRQLVSEDIQGNWFGFGNNTLWLIKIIPNKLIRSEQIFVEIRSNGLSHGTVHSIALKNHNVFWGVVNQKTSHPVGFAIFRDGEHIIMRVSQRGFYIDEMQLFRGKN